MAEFNKEMDMEMDVFDESTEEVEENGDAKAGIILAAALGAAVIVTVVCKKLKVREKLNERRIRKLEKAGYIVAKVDNPDEESDVDYDEE